MVKRALIFGVGGQDGSYLADLLLSKGYDVWGTVRRSSVDNLVRVRHLLKLESFHLLRADLLDERSVTEAISESDPNEVYNLADQDHVSWSESCPSYSIQVTAGGVQTILGILSRMNRLIRVLQPISATIFGDADPPQTTYTEMKPLSPYACAKAHALYLCRYYREKLDTFVSCPILYNHDSPRRGPDYLLQKIARGIRPDGDLSLPVDIGYALEYVEAMWRMLQQNKPTDEVIGTGTSYTIRDLWAFGYARLNGETGVIQRSGIISRGTTWLTPRIEGAARRLGWQATKDAADVLALIIDARRPKDGPEGKKEGKEREEGGGEPRDDGEREGGKILGMVEGAGRAEG